jgi:tRNA G46 methylase TrmB
MSPDQITKLNPAVEDNSSVIVELGMGEGELLKLMVENEFDINLQASRKTVRYIGIELDKKAFGVAKSLIKDGNHDIILLNGSYEQILPNFPDNSIDQILEVLPDPDFIDKAYQSRWKLFYEIVYSKLKIGGLLRLVTEITGDLYEPISDHVFEEWVAWLSQTLKSLGFTILHCKGGAPPEYSSRCLTQFRGDPQRIRMVTLDLVKKNSK